MPRNKMKKLIEYLVEFGLFSIVYSILNLIGVLEVVIEYKWTFLISSIVLFCVMILVFWAYLIVKESRNGTIRNRE